MVVGQPRDGARRSGLNIMYLLPGRFDLVRSIILIVAILIFFVGIYFLVDSVVQQVFKEKIVIVHGINVVMITFFLAALTRTDVSKDLDGFDTVTRAQIRILLSDKKNSYLRGVIFYIASSAFLFIAILVDGVFVGARYFLAVFVPFLGGTTMVLLHILYRDFIDVELLRDKVFEKQQIEKKREKLISQLIEAKKNNPLKPDDKLVKYRNVIGANEKKRQQRSDGES